MKDVLYFFREISKIPRETFHMREISDYLVGFGKERGLEVYQDDSLNVIIKKEASEGYEEIDPIILQAHMDMVCQKITSSSHDFSKDEIEVLEENGFLKANGTTLGADDGIGMAMILAILNGNYSHPKIEALFTVNEEVSMDGASLVDMNLLQGKRLINLDSEDEGVLTVGCAGGVQLNVTLPGKRVMQNGYFLRIHVFGLLGGHSGVDIDKKRVNGIRFLIESISKYPCFLKEISGGCVDNAICDDAEITILLEERINIDELKVKLLSKLKEMGEDSACIEINCVGGEDFVFDQKSTSKMISYLKNVPNGVISYSSDIKNQLSTSLNMGIIKTSDSSIEVHHLIRSSSESEKQDLLDQIFRIVETSRGMLKQEHSFPIWPYYEHSFLRDYSKKKYYEFTGKEMKVEITHGGLECGILAHRCKGLDCISIGPNIFDVHTPNERAEVESIRRVYEYLLILLKDIR